MKLLIRTFTICISVLCLIMICCQFMVIEVREKEFQTAVTIATHHLVDSYISQQELLGTMTPDEYKKLLDDGGLAYEVLRFEEYDGSEMTKSAKDGEKEIAKATVSYQADYDKNDLPPGVVPLYIHSVDIDLDDNYTLEGVYYTDDGFEKNAELKQTTKPNGSGQYIFGTANPTNNRQVYIRYYKEGSDRKLSEPLYFYTDDDFKNYFENDVMVQINTGNHIKFNYNAADVETGILDATVEVSFGTLGGNRRNLFRNVNTMNKIYPSESYLHEIVANQKNHMDAVKRVYREWIDRLHISVDEIGTNTYLVNPIENAKITAKTWNYEPDLVSGGVHLGVDFAATKNTPIVAPANGIILVSSGGCGDGALGNACSGDDPYAVSYGGNQIMMLAELNQEYYAITFSHMSNLWLHEPGLVNQGDLIGYLGTSGNSTGPHCHIEMIYLGSTKDGTVEDWNTIFDKEYTSSFNAGWGMLGYQNRCDFKEGTKQDCRVSALDYMITPEFKLVSDKEPSIIDFDGSEYYVVKQIPDEIYVIPTNMVHDGSYNEGAVTPVQEKDYYFTYSVTADMYFATMK